MSRILVAAAGSAAIGLVAWLTFGLAVRNLAEGLEGEEALGLVLLIPVALFLFVLIPLGAGIAGGALSRQMTGVVGSVVGYLAASLGAIAAIGNADSSNEGQGAFVVGVISAVVVAAGHFTGVAIRPRLQPA